MEAFLFMYPWGIFLDPFLFWIPGGWHGQDLHHLQYSGVCNVNTSAPDSAVMLVTFTAYPKARYGIIGDYHSTKCPPPVLKITNAPERSSRS